MTGTSTDDLTASAILPHSFGSSMSEAPEPALMTFPAGHPMLMSTNASSGFSPRAAREPSAMASGSEPKIWTPVTCPGHDRTNLADSTGLWTSPWAETISVTAIPAPNPSMNVR